MDQAALLTPVFVLVFWTFIVATIMIFGRIKHVKNVQRDAAHTKDLSGNLPAWVERASDNYNHLFEQPVAFYVVTLAIVAINRIDPFIIQLAWAFVLLRIIHSLVQLTFNYVKLRFAIFATAWVVVAYMASSQLF